MISSQTVVNFNIALALVTIAILFALYMLRDSLREKPSKRK